MSHLPSGAKLRNGGDRWLFDPRSEVKRGVKLVMTWRAVLARPDEGVRAYVVRDEFEDSKFEIAGQDPSQGA